jgi:hypothetical protein
MEPVNLVIAAGIGGLFHLLGLVRFLVWVVKVLYWHPMIGIPVGILLICVIVVVVRVVRRRRGI